MSDICKFWIVTLPEHYLAVDFMSAVDLLELRKDMGEVFGYRALPTVGPHNFRLSAELRI